LSDDGGLTYTEYGAADTLTRSYVLTAQSVNDAPTFTLFESVTSNPLKIGELSLDSACN
jgi:hypothetical protein